MHAFSDFLSHGGYIDYINWYGADDVSMCICMWCGEAYNDRVMFWISIRFVYIYYYVDWSPTSLIYTMLQEALLFNLLIMIQDLSILINAQDSTCTWCTEYE